MIISRKAKIFTGFLALLVICGVGFYLYHDQNSPVPSASQSESPKTAATQQPLTYSRPEGYTDASGMKDATFTFSYPAQYGALTSTRSNDGSSAYVSDKPAQEFGPGLGNGRFTVIIYDNVEQSVFSRKYGPEVQLKNGRWIVSKTDVSDPTDNKVGDEYKDGYGQPVKATDINGVPVFTFTGGDEGVIHNDLRFTTDGKLVIISLPSFDTGLYATTTTNDRSTYELLIKNVRASIRKIQ